MTHHDDPAASSHDHQAGRAHDGSDAEIAERVRAHHALMVADLDRLTADLRDAPPPGQASARRRLEEWFADVLVPHADEEEVTTYRAAGELPEGRLLIEAMLREHVLIKRLVTLVGDGEPAAAAAYGRAVFEAFSSHQAKENDVVLPLLVEAPQVSLADVMGGTHGHQLGDDSHRGSEQL